MKPKNGKKQASTTPSLGPKPANVRTELVFISIR
jgi:hypothetical protein